MVKLINHAIQNGLTMYWEEIRIKGLNKINSDFPKTKSELVFEDRFLDKIEKMYKTETIRNSPVGLGLYELRDNLTVEVVSVEKCKSFELRRNIIALSTSRFPSPHILYMQLGFNSTNDGKEFYESYLKHDFCYLIKFEVVNEN